MAKITGPCLSSFATGSIGKVMTFKRRHGAFFLSKKIVHTGRLKPHEIAFKKMVADVWKLRKFQGQRPVFYPDSAFGFGSVEDM